MGFSSNRGDLSVSLSHCKIASLSSYIWSLIHHNFLCLSLCYLSEFQIPYFRIVFRLIIPQGMANVRVLSLLLLLFTLLLPAQLIQGSRTQAILSYHQRPSTSSPFHLKGIISSEGKMKRNSRRLMIGSTAPTCTYNECRGCKYKCSAEQVPVEGNDPINSAYHYKCVCHR